jgi:hypothetical protein
MPVNNHLPPEGAQPNDNSFSPLRKWYTREQAMDFLKVGRTTFYLYQKEYGLKSSLIGNIRRFYEDDINDFLMGYRS